MLSADLVREARLRAGLSQAELGRRSGRPQSVISRWERGAARPSFETLQALVRACGLDLVVRLAPHDDSYGPHVERALALTPADRVRDAVRQERVYERIRRAGS